MKACVTATLALRNSMASIRNGAAKVLHEDRQNGVVAFERVSARAEGHLCLAHATHCCSLPSFPCHPFSFQS